MPRSLAFIDPDSLPEVKQSIRLVHSFKLEGLKLGEPEHFWDENLSYVRPYKITNGVLHIPVRGVLLNKFPYALGEFATGYEYIRQAYDRGLTDEAVDLIQFNVHSPGGDAAGLFDLTDHIYSTREQKPSSAFADDNALSAAYVIASSAESLVASRSSMTGSIGAVIMHTSFEEMLKDAGVEVTFIYAGKHKVDGNPYEGLSASAKSSLQKRVDKGYKTFVDSVARNRDMDSADVRKTEAGVFDSDEALALGLIDEVASNGLAQSQATLQTNGDEQMADPKTPQITQDDLNAAVAEATRESAKAAKTEERERLQKVFALAEYEGRESLATHLALNTDLSVEQIQGSLSSAQKVEPPKPSNGFGAMMDAAGDHPEIGVAAPKDDSGGADSPEAQGITLLQDYESLTGSKIRKRAEA